MPFLLDSVYPSKPWPVKILLAGAGFVVSCVAYLLGLAFYNLYFHPLRKYPGPKLLAASRLPYIRWMYSGHLAASFRELHERYGPIVRTAPNELSYTDPEAWKTIYGHHQAGEGFRKNPMFNPPASNGIHSLISAEGANHARMRRVLSYAFSDKALREQQDILQYFTNLLIVRLRETVQDPAKSQVDLFQWYNWTTFDLIGDLSFGEPFNCLQEAKFSEWVSLVFYAFKTITFINISKCLAPLDKLVALFIPKSLVKKRTKIFTMNSSKVDRRISSSTDRHDFLSYILKHNDEKGMTEGEVYANSTLLVLGGSESTASVISGMTYFLLKTPTVMKKAVAEVRRVFKTEEEINFDSVRQQPYLAAVVSEALRMYPPFPEGLPRVAPRDGAMVCGSWVPGGTLVQISQYAAHRQVTNFREPDSFRPERWLGDPYFASDNKEAAQPFSVGPRSCIGRNLAYLEMRLITARMLWSFDMELCPESQNWDKQDSWVQWDKKPLMVKLTPVARP